jgi:hypothetical protein
MRKFRLTRWQVLLGVALTVAWWGAGEPALSGDLCRNQPPLGICGNPAPATGIPGVIFSDPALSEHPYEKALTIVAIVGPDRGIIILKGEIAYGDGARFEVAARALESRISPEIPILVGFVSSPGGNLDAGIRIGKWIHSRRYMTVVDGDCASSCALAWAAGASRAINPNSSVYFHSAYLEGDSENADGTGNAMIGAYLKEVGYSINDIAGMIGHDPNQYNSIKNTTTNWGPWVRGNEP